MKTYEVQGSYYITRAKYNGKAAAVRAIRAQLPKCVMTTWPNGDIAVYLDRASMNRDSTGEHAVAVISLVPQQETANWVF